MKKTTFNSAYALVILAFGFILIPASMAHDGIKHNTVKTVTVDNITVYGESYFADLGPNTPLILLFHQAGSNGRGEYEDLIPWLNESGYRVIAWDQRSGGSHFGGTNRTVGNLSDGMKFSYCDTRPDLQAAHDYVIKNNLAKDMIIWGSSYSAALVFGLAADNPDTIGGVVSYSPATGDAMAKCRAKEWLEQTKGMMIYTARPTSELASERAQQQKALFATYDIPVKEIVDGVHGSSALVDSRTGHDMSKYRKHVQRVLYYMTLSMETGEIDAQSLKK